MQRKRNAKTATPVSTSRTRRVVIEFPKSLLDAADTAAADLDLNRSDVIRTAVKHYLTILQRKKLERELEEGYLANADLARAVAADMMESESGLS